MRADEKLTAFLELEPKRSGCGGQKVPSLAIWSCLASKLLPSTVTAGAELTFAGGTPGLQQSVTPFATAE
jgi:hypothetical protein